MQKLSLEVHTLQASIFGNILNALFRPLFFSITHIMWEYVCRDNAHYANYCKDEQSKSLKAMNLQSLHSPSISHSFFFFFLMNLNVDFH